MTLEAVLLNETLLHLIEAVMFLSNYISNQTEEAIIRGCELEKSVLFIFFFLKTSRFTTHGLSASLWFTSFSLMNTCQLPYTSIFLNYVYQDLSGTSKNQNWSHKVETNEVESIPWHFMENRGVSQFSGNVGSDSAAFKRSWLKVWSWEMLLKCTLDITGKIPKWINLIKQFIQSKDVAEWQPVAFTASHNQTTKRLQMSWVLFQANFPVGQLCFRSNVFLDKHRPLQGIESTDKCGQFLIS